MSKWSLLPIALLVASCSCGANHAEDLREQPGLVTAAQSVSLEFPFHFSASDNPPGYTKVAAGKVQNHSSGRLMDALVQCSPDLLWIERTSHTMSAVMPSQDNAIWEGIKAWHPSDAEIIACIRQSVSQPFFYRKVPKGTETYLQS
jgi:hypothetical protein